MKHPRGRGAGLKSSARCAVEFAFMSVLLGVWVSISLANPYYPLLSG